MVKLSSSKIDDGDNDDDILKSKYSNFVQHSTAVKLAPTHRQRIVIVVRALARAAMRTYVFLSRARTGKERRREKERRKKQTKNIHRRRHCFVETVHKTIQVIQCVIVYVRVHQYPVRVCSVLLK